MYYGYTLRSITDLALLGEMYTDFLLLFHLLLLESCLGFVEIIRKSGVRLGSDSLYL